MGRFGEWLGSSLGSLGSTLIPIKGVNGGELGGFLGSLAPFKKGGRVKKAQQYKQKIQASMNPNKNKHK